MALSIHTVIVSIKPAHFTIEHCYVNYPEKIKKVYKKREKCFLQN